MRTSHFRVFPADSLEHVEQATITSMARPVLYAFSPGTKMTERNQLSRQVPDSTLDTRGILGHHWREVF